MICFLTVVRLALSLSKGAFVRADKFDMRLLSLSKSKGGFFLRDGKKSDSPAQGSHNGPFFFLAIRSAA